MTASAMASPAIGAEDLDRHAQSVSSTDAAVEDRGRRERRRLRHEPAEHRVHDERDRRPRPGRLDAAAGDRSELARAVRRRPHGHEQRRRAARAARARRRLRRPGARRPRPAPGRSARDGSHGPGSGWNRRHERARWRAWRPAHSSDGDGRDAAQQGARTLGPAGSRVTSSSTPNWKRSAKLMRLHDQLQEQQHLDRSAAAASPAWIGTNR